MSDQLNDDIGLRQSVSSNTQSIANLQVSLRDLVASWEQDRKERREELERDRKERREQAETERNERHADTQRVTSLIAALETRVETEAVTRGSVPSKTILIVIGLILTAVTSFGSFTLTIGALVYAGLRAQQIDNKKAIETHETLDGHPQTLVDLDGISHDIVGLKKDSKDLEDDVAVLHRDVLNIMTTRFTSGMGWELSAEVNQLKSTVNHLGDATRRLEERMYDNE